MANMFFAVVCGVILMRLLMSTWHSEISIEKHYKTTKGPTFNVPCLFELCGAVIFTIISNDLIITKRKYFRQFFLKYYKECIQRTDNAVVVNSPFL